MSYIFQEKNLSGVGKTTELTWTLMATPLPTTLNGLYQSKILFSTRASATQAKNALLGITTTKFSPNTVRKQ
jgi:hypothetical protein